MVLGCLFERRWVTGIEKNQVQGLESIFRSDASYVPKLVEITGGGKKTPNQKAMAAVLKLAWSRVRKNRAPVVDMSEGVRDVLAIFKAMDQFGHMAIGDEYGNEQGAPDPHDIFWLAFAGTALREGRLQGIEPITNWAIQFLRDHDSLIDKFWTAKGCRMPCSRAKAPFFLPLKPNWTVDSWWYAKLNGYSTQPLDKPQSKFVIELLTDACKGIEAEIKKPGNVKLALPILKWEHDDGGYTAAFEHQTALNDPCAWLIVDANGDIQSAGKTLDTFERPGGEPERIGG